MLFLMNHLVGDRFYDWVIAWLESKAISLWNAFGALVIMCIAIALCLSLVVNFTVHIGGVATFFGSLFFQAFLLIVAIKWLLLFVVIGIPLIIIVIGIHRHMRQRRVNPTLRGLFLWAAILLII